MNTRIEKSFSVVEGRTTIAGRIGLATLLAILALVPEAMAQPVFSKSFSPSTIGPGSTTTLNFTITNNSTVGVRNLDFTDNLPAGVTIADPASASTDCFGGIINATAGDGTISYNDGSIALGASCTVTVAVTGSIIGTHTNISGDLTSDAGNSGTATADLVVSADRPGFSKSFSPATVPFGGRTSLTFTIDNSNNTASATNINFTDNLPLGITIASPANASTTCIDGNLSAPAGGSTISYGSTFPGEASVAAGGTCTVSVDVIGGFVGSLANITSDLSSRSGFVTRISGRASATLTVTNDRLLLVKSFLNDPVAPGDTVDLEFTIQNLDRASSASQHFIQ